MCETTTQKEYKGTTTGRIITNFLEYAEKKMFAYEPTLAKSVGDKLWAHSDSITAATKATLSKHPEFKILLSSDPDFFCKLELEMTLALIYGLAGYALDIQATHKWPVNETLLKYLTEEFQQPRKD